MTSNPTTTQPCPTCNGSGEAVYSCCTGEPVDNDFMICPVCHEHLGEEQCQECKGTGRIPDDEPNEVTI